MSTEHRTFFGKILAAIGGFFKGGLHAIAHTAVALTEEAKTLLSGGLVKGIADFIDSTLKTHIAQDVLDILNNAIPHILAVELAVEGLPENPTEQDILDFENRIFTAITGLPPIGASKLYTTLSAQIYGILRQALADNKFTFAEAVNAVETAYQDYLKDVADQQAADEQQ